MAPVVIRQIEASDLAWPKVENTTATGIRVACNKQSDGFSARRSMRHRSCDCRAGVASNAENEQTQDTVHVSRESGNRKAVCRLRRFMKQLFDRQRFFHIKQCIRNLHIELNVEVCKVILAVRPGKCAAHAGWIPVTFWGLGD